MKRKTKPTEKSFIMPSLFLDDLVAIEEIILTELKPTEYTVETEDYIYESVNSLKEKPVINALKILAYTSNRLTPQLQIDFRKSSATIEAGDNDSITIGTITKLANIISKRERKFLFCLIKAIPVFVIIPFLLLIKLIPEKTDISVIKLGLVIAYAVFLFLICFMGHKLQFDSYSRIKLVNSAEEKGFFIRNKDPLILGIFTTVLGTLLGVIATLTIQYYIKQ